MGDRSAAATGSLAPVAPACGRPASRCRRHGGYNSRESAKHLNPEAPLLHFLNQIYSRYGNGYCSVWTCVREEIQFSVQIEIRGLGMKSSVANHIRHSLKLASMLCVAAFFVGLAGNAGAANPIKNNTSTMNLAADWSDGAVPSNTKIAEFNNVFDQASLTLGGDVSVMGLLFDNNLSRVIIIGSGNTLTLRGTGNDIDMSAANRDVTINCSILFTAASHTWNVGSGKTLTIGGTISGNQNLTKTGSGLLIINNTDSSAAGLNIGATGGADAGTVRLGASGTLPTAGLAIRSGTLDFNGQSYTTRSAGLT